MVNNSKHQTCILMHKWTLKGFFKIRDLLFTELLKIMKLSNLEFYFLSSNFIFLSYKNTEPGDDQKQDLNGRNYYRIAYNLKLLNSFTVNCMQISCMWVISLLMCPRFLICSDSYCLCHHLYQTFEACGS